MSGLQLTQSGGAGVLNAAGAQNAGPYGTVVVGLPILITPIGITTSTYSYQTSAPQGSQSVLSSASVQAPIYTPDFPGEYAIALTDQFGNVYTVQFFAQKTSAIVSGGPVLPAYLAPSQVPTPPFGEEAFCDNTNSGRITFIDAARNIWTPSRGPSGQTGSTLSAPDLSTLQATPVTTVLDGATAFVRGLFRTYTLITTAAAANQAQDTYASATSGRLWCGQYSPLFFDPRLLAGGSTLVARYRSDVGVSLISGGGTTVAAWAEFYGTGRDLLQATTGLQPAFITAAQNGKPAVRGNGINPNGAFLKTAAFTLNQPYTVIAAMKINALSAPAVADTLWDGFNTASSFWLEDNNGGGRVEYSTDGGVHILTANSAPGNGAACSIVAQNNNASTTVIRANGTQLASGNAGTGAMGGLTLFALANGTRASADDFYELALFSSALSTADMQAYENYIRFWYATP